MNPAISIENVKKTLGRREILKGIKLQCRNGRYLRLSGSQWSRQNNYY